MMTNTKTHDVALHLRGAPSLEQIGFSGIPAAKPDVRFVLDMHQGHRKKGPHAVRARPQLRRHGVADLALDHAQVHLNPSGLDLPDARPAHGGAIEASDEMKTLCQ